jgi:hypothetical protein
MPGRILVLLLSTFGVLVGCAAKPLECSLPSPSAVEEYPPYVTARARCDGGDGRSCAWIATMYRFGVQLPWSAANVHEGVRHAERACTLGFVEGCHDVGVAYVEAWGVTRDLDRARVILDEACARSFAPSCVLFASLFPGRLVPEPRAASVLIVLEADCAAQPKRVPRYVWQVVGNGIGSDPSSCEILARMLEAGRGTEIDLRRARELFARVSGPQEVRERALSVDGEACGLGCRGSLEGSSSCVDGVCVADLRAGERCDDVKRACTRGTFCSERRTCEAKKPHGSPCTSGHQCASDFCSARVCADPPVYPD